tara:strand:- start:4994 stop:5137 length:144 start_codon:yes stop_codon:yes gene_type:complete
VRIKNSLMVFLKALIFPNNNKVTLPDIPKANDKEIIKVKGDKIDINV